MVNSLLANPRELLITIYIGNELVNIAISIVATSIAIEIFGSVGVGIAIGVGTFLLLLFGEVIPKSMSLRFAENYSIFACYPLKIFSKLVKPPQRILTFLAEKFISAMGIRFLSKKSAALSEKEIQTMVRLGEGEGVIDSEEGELIHNILEFGDTTVEDIMVPKIDIFAVNEDNSLDEILPLILKNFYSRVPVYDSNEENIIGVLFTKDLNKLKRLAKEKFNLKSALHPCISVPRSKKIKELLEEFRKSKRHLAIVLDEYGSVFGLVTLEDILEELVGEIDSEMRQDEAPFLKMDETTFRISARYPLSEFNEQFQSQLPEEQFNTLGGLVFGAFGRVPRSGETITCENFKFRVEKMKGPRILKLHMTLLPAKEPETKENETSEAPSTL